VLPTLQNGSTIRSSRFEFVDPARSWCVVLDDHSQHGVVAVSFKAPFVSFMLDNEEDVPYNYNPRHRWLSTPAGTSPSTR